MTIQDLGNIGELIAAITTVATLAYLAMQIRQNTRSTRAAMIQASDSQASSFTSLIGSDTAVARVWRLGLSDPTKLDADEYIQFLIWPFLSTGTKPLLVKSRRDNGQGVDCSPNTG